MSELRPWYRNYVLCVLTFGYVLNSFDRSILGILLEPIKLEFAVSDTYLGLLSGVAFAAFYATLGMPVAFWADRSNRRNVLALAILLWSAMTALCGLAASFLLLLLARIGTAIGEAGGSPPSHSLIADYFAAERRGTALSIYALGAPAGAMLAGLLGGIGNELFGWRVTFVLAAIPGLVLAPLVLATIVEPRTAAVRRTPEPAPSAGKVRRDTTDPPVPRFFEVVRFLAERSSFRHLCLACALHSMAMYGAWTFNASFLIRSHGWGTAEVGTLLAMVGAFGLAGTLVGGILADRLSARRRDSRWSMWVPAAASLLLVPFQLIAYLAPGTATVVTAFVLCGFLSAVFFGPSFATVQALAAVRMRSTAAAVLIFVKTMIGLGVGPLLIGRASDLLMPVAGQHSLRYALLLAGAFNLWSALHFVLGAVHLRSDLEKTRRFDAAPVYAARVQADERVSPPVMQGGDHLARGDA
jgi:MFS family permease